MEILSKSSTRFELSNDGWRRMNAGRSAYELIREAVANAFDQEDVTEIRVSFQLHGKAVVTIEDNSPTGIKDPALVTTVFLTDKEESHTKRGRKGRGLKELLATAEYATVDTVGHRIEFLDGRTVYKSDRTCGTEVKVHVNDWGLADIAESRKYLNQMIPPPHVVLYVDDVPVVQRLKRSAFYADLTTQIITDGVQRDVQKQGCVEIINLAKGERTGWLYEMGIPVQQLKTRFHINVQQRIPLNDNRNNADDEYLKTLYARCLAHLMPSMSRGALKHEWVSEGLYEASSTVHKEYVRKMYGNLKKLAVKGRNTRANDVVKQHGVELVDTTGLSYDVGRVIAWTIPSSEEMAKAIDDADQGAHIPSWNADSRARTTTLVKYLAERILGYDLNVEFFKREVIFTGKQREADFNFMSRTIRFNTGIGLDFNNPINPKILSLIAHEFAHAKYQEHDEHFREEVERISGLISSIMYNEHAALRAVFGANKKSIGTGRAN